MVWNLTDCVDLVKFKDFHPRSPITHSSDEHAHSLPAPLSRLNAGLLELVFVGLVEEWE